MKKISRILLVIGCLFMLCSCEYSKEERQILNTYEELSALDYVEKYDFLNDETNVFKSIEYKDLLNKLEEDTFVLYVGGAWCPNCQAVVKFINESAKANNIEFVYNFDTRISSLKTKENDIRNCNNEAQLNLYRKLIESLEYTNPSGTTTEGTDVQRLAVPAIFVIKDGNVLGSLVREYFYDEENDLLYVYGEEIDRKEEYMEELNSLFSLLK